VVGDSPKRVLRVDARRNRKRLLQQAHLAVQEVGTEASLRDIARRAGVGLGTLYRHFPTREGLLEALLHEMFARFAARGTELRGTQTPVDALTLWLQEYLDGAAPYRGLSAVLVDSIMDPKSALFASCSAMREAVGALLGDAQASGDVREDVDSVDVFVLLNAVSWTGDQHPVIAGRQQRLFEVVLSGLIRRAPG